MVILGFVSLIPVILYAIPQTSIFGAILLAAFFESAEMATASRPAPWPPFSVASLVITPVATAIAAVPLPFATASLESALVPVAAVAFAHAPNLIAPIALPLIAVPSIASLLLLSLVLVRGRLVTNIVPKRLRRREGH